MKIDKAMLLEGVESILIWQVVTWESFDHDISHSAVQYCSCLISNASAGERAVHGAWQENGTRIINCYFLYLLIGCGIRQLGCALHATW